MKVRSLQKVIGGWEALLETSRADVQALRIVEERRSSSWTSSHARSSIELQECICKAKDVAAESMLEKGPQKRVFYGEGGQRRLVTSLDFMLRNFGTVANEE